jgi:hypothetical protein
LQAVGSVVVGLRPRGPAPPGSTRRSAGSATSPRAFEEASATAFHVKRQSGPRIAVAAYREHVGVRRWVRHLARGTILSGPVPTDRHDDLPRGPQTAPALYRRDELVPAGKGQEAVSVSVLLRRAGRRDNRPRAMSVFWRFSVSRETAPGSGLRAPGSGLRAPGSGLRRIVTAGLFHVNRRRRVRLRPALA